MSVYCNVCFTSQVAPFKIRIDECTCEPTLFDTEIKIYKNLVIDYLSYLNPSLAMLLVFIIDLTICIVLKLNGLAYYTQIEYVF